MKNMEETRSAVSDSEQNELSEYRFVYNRVEVRKATFLYVVLFLIFFALWTYPCFLDPVRWGKAQEALFIPFFPLAIIFFLLVVSLIGLQRLVIIINQEGITRKGDGLIQMPQQMPQHCAWSELSQICATTQTKGILAGRWLVFILHHVGKPYSLFVSNRRRPLYVGVGHSLSLEETLERFMGPMEVLSEAEKAKVPRVIPP
jgi:hypothetical protein